MGGFVGIEPGGAFFSFVGDFAVGAYDVDSVGEALVGFFDFVVHVVDDDGDFYAHFFGAVGGGFFTLGEGFVGGDEDAIADVGSGLVAVGGVGFSDVDDAEIGFILFLAEPTVQLGHVCPEWGSGVRAENKDSWFFVEVAG